MPIINPPPVIADIPDLEGRLSALEDAPPGSAAWGDISGTLSDQSDLQTELDGKSDTGHSHVISDTTGLQTALDGKQPLDSDLTTIAGLTATTNNFMVANSSAWASRTPAQAKVHLSLVKGDVGLGNVDNTADTAKPVSTAQQTALDLKANLAAPTLTGLVKIGTPFTGENSLRFAFSDVPANPPSDTIVIYNNSGTLTQRNSSGVEVAFGLPDYILEGRTSSIVNTGANTTPVNVPNAVFTTAGNSCYVMEVIGAITAAASTTGCALQWDVSGSGIATLFFQTHHSLANTGTITGSAQVADDASQSVSSGIPSNGATVPIYGIGTLTTGLGAGTCQLRLRSEVAAVVSLAAGTVVRVRRLPFPIPAL